MVAPERINVLIFGPPEEVRNHLTRALAQHCRWCRANGIAVPVWLHQLLDELAHAGQERPIRPPGEFGPHDGDVLLIDHANAAARLGVSERTVRRLVAAGKLPAVSVAGSRRIRVTDLATYVEEL